jgi:hypothetical protein
MAWFKADDKLHSHRKTRKVLRSGTKRRDAAPLGLWIAAGTWSADNLTDGFIPADELEAWDDDATALAARLVDARLWVEDELDGEPGYRFHDWSRRNPDAASVLAKREAESEGGRRGNHVRWHVSAGIAVADCEFCNPEGSVTRSGTRSGDDQVTRVAPESSRPGPSRPAAAAGAAPPLPPALEILKARLDASKMTARWDRLTAEQHEQIEQLIEVHGDAALVKSAIAQYRPGSPAVFAQAWLPGWQTLIAPGTALRLVDDPPCPKHEAQGGTTRHCASCAADRLAGDA